MDLVSFFLYLLSFHLLLLGANSACQESIQCGSFSLEFPFTNTMNPGCGLIVVDGCDSRSPKTILGPAGYRYTILEKIPPNQFRVQDTQLLEFFNNDQLCLPFRNLTTPQFHPLSFAYFPNITLFTCFNQTSDDQIQSNFTNYSRINVNHGRSHCQSDSTTVYYSYGTADDLPGMEESGIPTACSMIQLPLKPGDSDDLFSWSTPNFILEWSVPENCFRSDSGNEYDCKEGIIC